MTTGGKMPKYGYKCPECALRWEAWGSMKDIPPLCPSCGGAHGERVPSTVFFVNKKGPDDLKSKKTGETTKEHIEENREILKKMKENTKNKE